jgi:hypothetical protein
MSDAPKTTAEALVAFRIAVIDLYISMAWPFWAWLKASIGQVPDRAEFEQAIRAYYLGAPTAAESDQEDPDA